MCEGVEAVLIGVAAITTAAVFAVSPDTKVGVSYCSAISDDLTGAVAVDGSNAGINSAGTSSAKASLKLPDVFTLSATQWVCNKWELLGDFSWTGWSSIPKLDVVRTDGATSGQIAQTLDTDFRDTWRVAVGANYRLSSDVKLKFGVAFDQTPAKGPEPRVVSLPDNDRTWLSTGAQWVPSKGSALDVGIAYLYIKETSIDNNQAAVPNFRGRVTGSYVGSLRKRSCKRSLPARKMVGSHVRHLIPIRLQILPVAPRPQGQHVFGA